MSVPADRARAAAPGDELRSGHGGGPRERMVQSAAALIAQRGLRATGMREVAVHAQAPRGSIGHYFPGGKDQLTLEALSWMGAAVHGELAQAASPPTGSAEVSGGRAVAVLETFVEMWRHLLEQTDITAGCSIAAVIHDTDDPLLLARAREVFDSWRSPFRLALVADGAPDVTAHSLATTALAALEGAVILCRAERGLTPLDQTAGVLRELLARSTRPAR